MALFYLPEAKTGATQLSPEESKHAIKVLRLQEGDAIELIDGIGGKYKARITSANHKICEFEVLEKATEKPKDFFVHIAIAPTKNIDRMEWFVEKAVEIGIDEISFVHTSHSERKVIKLDRLEKKAISAMKQSLKAKLPKINALTPINEFIVNTNQTDNYIAYVDFSNPKALQQLAPKKSDYCVLIGPEGDFSEDELELAIANGFTKVSLGTSRLRTETAGLVACHLLNIINS